VTLLLRHWLGISLCAVVLPAQTAPGIVVTSEFRTTPGGREILSPAAPRGGWSSYHILVSAKPLTEFTLYIGQNPDDFVRPELYRDGQKVELPYKTVIPPGAGTLVLRFDFFVPADAPVRRIKVEPQVYTEESGWIVYPMEVRVVEPQVPPLKVEIREGAPLLPPLLAHFCGGPAAPAPRTIAQDLALTWTRIPEDQRSALQRALGVADLAAWCRAPVLPEDAEWYLRFRDFFLGQRRHPSGGIPTRGINE
jgi:hypothetical protein